MMSNIEFLYEEIRKVTDGGSESMTHEDAIVQIKYWEQEADKYKALIEGASIAVTNKSA